LVKEQLGCSIAEDFGIGKAISKGGQRCGWGLPPHAQGAGLVVAAVRVGEC